MANLVQSENPAAARALTLCARTGAALLLLLVVLLAGIALLPSSFWRGVIVHAITRHTGRSATIDKVTLHLWSLQPELEVEGLKVANAPWARATPLLTVQHLDVALKLASLMHGALVFPRVSIDTPSLDLERDSSGRLNWEPAPPQRPSSAATGPPLHIPVIQQLSVTHGKLAIADRIRKLEFEGEVSVEEDKGAAADRALRLQGSGMLNKKPFALRAGGEPLLGVDGSRPYSFEAAITAADIKLRSRIVIAHPFDMASISAKFDLSGADLADVYYLTGLALPNTPPYDISGTLDRNGLQYAIENLHGKLGESDIAGKLAIDTAGQRPKLAGRLTSTELNLADLAAPLGTGPSALRQPDTLHPATPPTAAEAPSAGPALLLPDADLQVERVRGMDADVILEAASVVTPKVPLKKLRFHLTLDDGRLTLSPLTFTLPEGQFSGTVTVDARGAVPQTDLDMRLANVNLDQFKPKSGGQPPLEGQILGRIRLHGSGTSVHKTAANADGDATFVIPKGEMREVFAELTGINVSRGLGLFLAKSDATTEIRCGVANFRASRGDLHAATLVVDTTHVLITGQGHVDLKTEALDLALRGQPKEVRLFRLRSPITVKGSLLHPQIGVQAGKAIGQAGGAAALGALLTPLAAVLAFVDRGLAKDANCAGLLTQAEQGHDLHPPAN